MDRAAAARLLWKTASLARARARAAPMAEHDPNQCAGADGEAAVLGWEWSLAERRLCAAQGGAAQPQQQAARGFHGRAFQRQAGARA